MKDSPVRTVCVGCASEMLSVGEVTLRGDFRDQPVTVTMPGFSCLTCGHQTIHGSQFGEFQRRSADEYRRLKGLLTSDDLRAARRALRMSQKKFASYLDLGVASLKRWERGEVQSKMVDRWVRVKTDQVTAQESLQHLARLLNMGPDTGTVTPTIEQMTNQLSRRLQWQRQSRILRPELRVLPGGRSLVA